MIKKMAGCFEVTVTYQGKRLRERAETLEAALAFCRSLGKDVYPGKTKTFRDGIEKYWALHGHYLKGTSNTWFNREANKVLGDVPLEEVGAHLQAAYDGWVASHSVGTAERIMYHIQAVINRLREWGDYSGGDPARRLRRARLWRKEAE